MPRNAFLNVSLLNKGFGELVQVKCRILTNGREAYAVKVARILALWSLQDFGTECLLSLPLGF